MSYQDDDSNRNQDAVDNEKQDSDNAGMDWKTLISEIQASGLSQVEIGDRVGKSQAWVSAVTAGKYEDLKWKDGEALRAIHQEVCCASRQAA